MAELGGLDEEVAELAPPTSTPARQQPGMPAPQIWAAALEELRRGGRVPEATERTWIANVEAAGYADGAIELVAPNTFALEWLETRFRPAIEAAVGRVAPGLGVAFVRRWEAAAG